MSLHVSVGLAQVGTVDVPKNAIRLGICKFVGTEDTEAILSVADARMVAALLITAADHLMDRTTIPVDVNFASVVHK